MATHATKRLLAVNSASTLIRPMVGLITMVWMNKYLLDRLTPEEFSLYPVIASVVAFSPLLSGFLTSGIARFVVEADAKEDDRRVTQIVSTMFPLLALTGTFTFAVGIVFSLHVERILTIDAAMVSDARLMAALMISNVALTVISMPFCLGPYVRQRFVILNVIGLGVDLLRVLLLLTLLLAVSPRVLWIAVASLCASCCGLAVTLFLSQRLVPALKFRISEFRWSIAKTLLNFGAWIYLGRISALIYENADRIILNKFGTAVDVNAFHLGALADTYIRHTVMRGASPLQPAMTTMYAHGQMSRLGNAYIFGNRYALWATLFIAAPLFVFRNEVIQLYVGSRYSEAATVIALLLMTYPFVFSNQMLPKIAVATASLRPFQLRTIFTHIINLLLSVYFVWHLKLGAIGPALATFLICSAGQPLLFWGLGWRMANVSPSRWARETFIPGTAPALVGGAVMFAVQAYDPPASWLEIIALSAVGSVVYLIALFGFCLHVREKKELKKLLATARAKLKRTGRSSTVSSPQRP